MCSAAWGTPPSTWPPTGLLLCLLSCDRVPCRGHARICKLLVEKGGDVNLRDGEHHTPIHVASQTGHADCVSLLSQGRLGPHLEETTIYQVRVHLCALAT